MPSIIATLKVKEELIDEARNFLKQQSEKILANEPGTLAYVVHQKQGEPATFILYEKYADDAALAAHGKNLQALNDDFARILAGRPEITMIDEI